MLNKLMELMLTALSQIRCGPPAPRALSLSPPPYVLPPLAAARIIVARRLLSQSTTQLVSHSERVFSDLLQVHVAGGHCKSNALFKRACCHFGGSIPRALCQEFGKLCPGCKVAAPRKKVQAGHTPIVTKGFGSRGLLLTY